MAFTPIAKRIFLSTLSLRRATDYVADLLPATGISIHALLAESDSQTYFPFPKPSNFYPRSPCGERRKNFYRPVKLYQFLSTLSLRRATGQPHRRKGSGLIISIHALLAESDSALQSCTKKLLTFLSTLSLRRATTGEVLEGYPDLFLSTLSLRRATDEIAKLKGLTGISIHALLAESDD